jgi:hypothetical protein
MSDTSFYPAVDISYVRSTGNAIKVEEDKPKNNESLLEYLESSLGSKKPDASSKANDKENKAVYEKNYFDGLSQWIDSMSNYLKVRSNDSATNLHPSPRMNSTSQENVIFYRLTSLTSPTTSRSSTEVSRNEDGVAYNSSIFSGRLMNRPESMKPRSSLSSLLLSDEAVSNILSSTETIIYELVDIDEEFNHGDSDETMIPFVQRVLDSMMNIELAIVWLRYHLHAQDNYDTHSSNSDQASGSTSKPSTPRTPPPASSQSHNPPPIQPRQIFIYAYRIVHLIEQIGNFKIWSKFASIATSTSNISSAYVIESLFRVTRLLICGNEIQAHINLVNLSNPNQQNHGSRHVPSTIADANPYATNMLLSRLINEIFTLLRPLIAMEASYAMMMMEAEALCMVIDLLSYCHISSITGLHYHSTSIQSSNQWQYQMQITSPYLPKKSLRFFDEMISSSNDEDDEDQVNEQKRDRHVAIDERAMSSSDEEDEDDFSDDAANDEEELDQIVARLQLPLPPSSSNTPPPPLAVRSPASSTKRPSASAPSTDAAGNIYLNQQQTLELVEKTMALIASLPSPSLIRSRLCYAAVRYYEAMRKGKLIWQTGSTAPAGVGISPSTSSPSKNKNQRFEMKIMRLYEQAFDVPEGRDPIFVEQLLIFEAAADLFHPMSDASSSMAVQDLLESSTHPLPSLMQSSWLVTLPMLLDLSQHWQDNGSTVSSSDARIRFYQCQDISHHSYLVFSFFARLIVDRSSDHAYSLLDLNYHLLRASSSVSSSIISSSASVYSASAAIAVYEQDLNQMTLKLKRDMLMLASKNQDHEKIIDAAVFLLERLTTVDITTTSTPPSFDHNLVEIKFLLELASKSYVELGYFEKAVQISHEYIRVLTHRLGKCIGYLDPNSAKYHLSLEKIFHRYHKFVDMISLKIGQIYLTAAIPSLAAIEFQRLLEVLTNRRSMYAYDLKIATLTWLFQAYYDMNNLEVCKKIVTLIKSMRNDVSVSSSPNPTSSTSTNAQSFDLNLDSLTANDLSNMDPSIRQRYQPNQSSSTASSPSASTIALSAYPSNLPKVGVIQYNIDLGESIARVYHKSQGYIAALKSLTPTIIGLEFSAIYIQQNSINKSIPNFISSLSEAKLELARLYMLRGEIEFEAARSSVVKYPFVIGSSQLYAAIRLVYEQIGLLTPKPTKSSNATSSSAGSSASQISEIPITCRHGVQYKCPSDLLHDAMKWFERSWEFYRSSHRPVEAAMAANRLAACHLEALYVPIVFFQKPRDLASDLSTGVSLASSAASVGENEHSSYDQMDRSLRTASNDAINRAVTYSLQINSEELLPIGLLESYLSMAELKLIQDEPFEAIAYWWEARELFFHLFVDSSTIPVLRRCSVTFANQLSTVLDRLVRFLWACERPLINQNLILLDMHILMSHEVERIQKQAMNRSNQTSIPIDRLLETIRYSCANNPSSSSSNQTVNMNPNIEYPAATNSLPIEYKRILIAWMNYTSSSSSTSSSPSSAVGTTTAASQSSSFVLDRIAHYPNPDIIANQVNMNINSASTVNLSTPRSATNRMPSRSFDSTTDDMLLTAAAYDRDYVRTYGLYPWTIDGNSSSEDPYDHNDTIFIENIWRCFVIMSSSSSSSSSHRQPVSIIKKSLRSLSILMKRYRLYSKQYDAAADIAFDHLLRCFVRRTNINESEFVRLDASSTLATYSSSSKKIVSMQDRMQHIVFCIKVDELLMMYRPYAGTQYIQPFTGTSYVTYAEKSQAWLLQQTMTNVTSSSVTGLSNTKTIRNSKVGSNGLMMPMSTPSNVLTDEGYTLGRLISIDHDPIPDDFGTSMLSVPTMREDNNPHTSISSASDLNSGAQNILEADDSMNDDSDILESGFGNISGTSVVSTTSSNRRSLSYRSISNIQPIRSSVSISCSSNPSPPSLKTSHPIPTEFISPITSNSNHNYPSYASIASSTNSTRIPKSGNFTSEQSKFLFELSIEANDMMCGGGYELRKKLLEQLRDSEFLRGAIDFIRDAEYDPITPSNDESSGASSSLGRRQYPSNSNAVSSGEDSRKYNAFLPSGLMRMFQSQRLEAMPPSMPPPITIICSKTTGAIPWENLASQYPPGHRGPHQGSQLVIVRQASMLTMYSFVRGKGGRYLTGPSWNQSPVYLSIAHGINGFPIRLASDVKARELSRRIVSSIHNIESVTRKVSHLVRISKELIITSLPMSCSTSDEIHRRYIYACQSMQDRIWPCPSALLPLGKISAQSLRSRRLKKFIFYDISMTSSFDIRHLSSWIDHPVTVPVTTSSSASVMSQPIIASLPAVIALSSSSYPVIILTYADLLEISEAVTLLLMTRGDAVIIFVPHFCQGTVAKEIVRCLDSWCTASTINSASSNQSTTNNNQASSSHYNIHRTNNYSNNNPLQSSSVSSSDRIRENSHSSTNSSSQSQDFNAGISSPLSPSLSPFNRPESPSGNMTVHSNAANTNAGVLSVASTIYEPSEVDLSVKTLAYHAIMDTVTRLQNELAVPIVVFI